MSNEQRNIKLFLSIDVVDSTKIKDKVSLNKFHKRINQRKQLIEKSTEYIRNKNTLNNYSNFDSEELTKNVRFSNIDPVEVDWSYSFENFFIDFHSRLSESLKRNSDKSSSNDYFWKAIGDELVYCFNIENCEQLHTLVLSFTIALREFDCANDFNLRVKGTVWTAEFPIRNKIIPLPNGSSEYVGLDMDIGFRLGKEVWAGFLVASIDVLYLLSLATEDVQIKYTNVGWCYLKGVWNELHYPVYWLTIFDNLKIEKTGNDYQEFNLVDVHRNKYLQKLVNSDGKYERQLVFKEVKVFQKAILDIVDNLPSELGVTIPHIPNTEIKKPSGANRDNENLQEIYQRTVAEQEKLDEIFELKQQYDQEFEEDKQLKHDSNRGRETDRASYDKFKNN